MPTTTSYRHALLIVAATACWGSGTVLSKQVLERGVEPLTLLTLELGASCLSLLLVAVVLGVRWSRSRNLAKLAALGLLNPGLAYALGLVGLVSISASLSVLIWATEPILIMGLAVLLLRERIAGPTIVAVAAALVGVLLVLYRPGAGGDAIGMGLTGAAVAACAFYTVLTRLFLLNDTALQVVLAQQAAALVFALALGASAWAMGASGLGLPADMATWVLAAASGVLYYGLAFWFFISGLRGVTAAVAGCFFPLVPVFGLTGGYLAGDRLGDRQWVGAVVVVAAVAAAVAYQLRRDRHAGIGSQAAS